MRILILLIVVFFFLQTELRAQSYFVKLTPAGIAKKASLLNYTRPASGLKKQAVSIFKKIIDVPNQPALFRTWLEVQIRTEQDKAYLQSLRQQNLVEKIEPIGYFKIQSITNDSLVDQQWYLPRINMPEAWHITKGDSSVIVAIIDTGVDYLHPDLAANIWHNQAELNGQPGVDDDGNGYVDDVNGWDFTDAPRFPDGGDYLNPDPDPMDEFSGGHGTEVAGIVAAVQNNYIGISGIAPNVKIMALRAGTASGYLEEDDVIRALIYAQSNGAKIVNMSFGDKQVSGLFHDVLRYLESKGMILIAAAGNDGDQEVYYPAGFNETIAVGASGKNDWLAGFSNYGNVLDLIAPGVDMLSTAPGNAYNSVNGTSFATPVVSAVAALILSRHPDFNNEEVRTVLKGTATDLAAMGMDPNTGAGRVDAFRAVQVEKSGDLQIIQPAPQTYIKGNHFPVVVTAYHPDLQSVRLEYGLGQNPTRWMTLANSNYHFYLADTIAFLPLKNLPDTTLALRLSMHLLNGQKIEVLRTVHIDRTPPVILDFKRIPAYEGTEPLLLYSIKTDDPTDLKALITLAGDRRVINQISQSNFTTTHFIKISKTMAQSGNQLSLRFANSAGLMTFRVASLHFPQVVNQSHWQAMGKVLPKGYLLPRITDLDNNQKKEIILSRSDQNNTFGPVHVYEFSNGHFVDRWHTQKPYIPRDAGDVNGNGKNELLLGFGSYSCLMEADNENGYPEHIIWQDSSFWAAALTDLDQDGKGEIIGYRDSVYQVLEWDGQQEFRKVATLPNPTTGENRLGVPCVTTGDFNNDGQPDIAFGDYDGDVIVYTCTGNNQFQLLMAGHGSQSDATDLLQMTSNAIFTLTHTAEDENLESQWEQRYWSLDVLIGRGQRLPLNTSLISGFYPFYPKKNFGSGLKYFQQNGTEYLFAGVYPYLYLLQKTPEGWQTVWVNDSFNSNAIVTYDFNNDGNPECYFNNGTAIVGFGRENVSRPASPVNLRAQGLDSVRIRLQWDGSSADGFFIYRGESAEEMHFLTRTFNTEFIDNPPEMGQCYYYQVTAFDSSATYTESMPSNRDSAKTGVPPRLIKAWQENADQIILVFDRPMGISSLQYPRAFLNHSQLESRSLTVVSPENRLMASFEKPIPPDSNEVVTVTNVFSKDGIPVDLRFDSLHLICNKNFVVPHVIQIRIEDRHTIDLTFNVSMNEKSLLDLSHYKLTPSGQVISVSILNDERSQIELKLSPQSMAGGFGQDAYLILNHLKSNEQIEMDSPQEISLIRPVNDLQHLVIYPQPVRPENEQLIFAKLPQNTQIQIFTLNGRNIRSFNRVNDTGGIIWDLRDQSGKRVGSGIYFYRVECEGKERVGKLVIVR